MDLAARAAQPGVCPASALLPDEGICAVLRQLPARNCQLVTEWWPDHPACRRPWSRSTSVFHRGRLDDGVRPASISRPSRPANAIRPARAAVRPAKEQQDAEQIARALQGPGGGAPLRVECGAVELLGSSTTGQISVCDEQTPDAPPDVAGSKRRRAAGRSKQRRRKRRANGPRFDARREVYRVDEG